MEKMSGGDPDRCVLAAINPAFVLSRPEARSSSWSSLSFHPSINT